MYFNDKNMNNILAKIIKYLLSVWSITAILLLFFTAFVYIRWNGFGEQGEVNFATVSWLIYQGYPLYTDIDFFARYSLQHGPIAYLFAGGMMTLLTPSYFTAKLSGILALFLSIIVSWCWFSRMLGNKYAFWLLGLEIWMLFHWHHIYFIRPDIMMFLCVLVSMYILTTIKRQWLLILGLAIPLGLMINLKIHGVLYFLPVLALAYKQYKLKHSPYVILLIILFALLPFTLPAVSLSNYLTWLTASLHHGFSWSNFTPKLATILALFLLPLGIGKVLKRDIKMVCIGNKLVLMALIVPLFIVAIISSKTGSGTNHLMPFLPVFFYFIMQIIITKKSTDKFLPEDIFKNGKVAFYFALTMLLLLVITIRGISAEKRFIKEIYTNDRVAILADFYNIQKKYDKKTLEVACDSGSAVYKEYRDLIPLPVFAGSPLLFESVAMGDMNTAGIPLPQQSLDAIENGIIDIWLVPSGEEPFKTIGYRKKNLSDKSLQEIFLINYKLVEKTKFFDIWQYNRLR